MRGKMLIHLEPKDLINSQQMEVAVNGPDGATHLILCTGVAKLHPVSQDTFTFLVGPRLSRRQFVGAIASGAISTIRVGNKNPREGFNEEMETDLIAISALFDDASGQVKVFAEVVSSIPMVKLGISYSVNILAELPSY